jgi:hypothetical protein
MTKTSARYSPEVRTRAVRMVLGMEAVGDLGKIDRFLFQRPPEALDEDVVEEASAPIHRHAHACPPCFLLCE